MKKIEISVSEKIVQDFNACSEGLEYFRTKYNNAIPLTVPLNDENFELKYCYWFILKNYITDQSFMNSLKEFILNNHKDPEFFSENYIKYFKPLKNNYEPPEFFHVYGYTYEGNDFDITPKKEKFRAFLIQELSKPI